MNTVILMGRLTADPEVREARSMNVARYSLAIDRPTKAGEEKQTDFINCIAFAGVADFVKSYLHKGMKIAVKGRLQTGSYTDKNGIKRNIVDVVVQEHEFCESKQKQKQATQTQGNASGFYPVDDVEEEDLPF